MSFPPFPSDNSLRMNDSFEESSEEEIQDSVEGMREVKPGAKRTKYAKCSPTEKEQVFNAARIPEDWRTVAAAKAGFAWRETAPGNNEPHSTPTSPLQWEMSNQMHLDVGTLHHGGSLVSIYIYIYIYAYLLI